jgi:hypothetical protein
VVHFRGCNSQDSCVGVGAGFHFRSCNLKDTFVCV